MPRKKKAPELIFQQHIADFLVREHRSGAEARGQRTVNGFVVFQGSTAVLEERPSAEIYPCVVAQRKQLIADGTLIDKDGFLVFTNDAEFSSPSAAAVMHGVSVSRLIAWKTEGGKFLKQLDKQA
jgi:hypothetical protein